MELTFTLKTMAAAAAELLAETGEKRVFAIHGEMGAGKTTFVYALCKNLGVVDDVSSPTFPIINEYETASGKSIFHIDLYRLDDINEALQAGVGEAIDSGDTCFVEWPERAPAFFGEDSIHLYLTVINETTRLIRTGDNKYI